MPFIARSSSSILYQLDPALEEASISLGVNPMKTFFKITIRLMAGGIIAGAILTWVTTISELSSTIVLQTPGWSTMTVWKRRSSRRSRYMAFCAAHALVARS